MTGFLEIGHLFKREELIPGRGKLQQTWIIQVRGYPTKEYTLFWFVKQMMPGEHSSNSAFIWIGETF